jgi:hypothetical protein
MGPTTASIRRSKSAARIIGLGWRQDRALVIGRAGGGGRYRHSRYAFGDQNRQVEHAEPNSDQEKPGIHLPGNPVEAKQALFHRDSTRTKTNQIMLQRNTTHRSLLQTFYEILLRRESNGSRFKTRRTPE